MRTSARSSRAERLGQSGLPATLRRPPPPPSPAAQPPSSCRSAHIGKGSAHAQKGWKRRAETIRNRYFKLCRANLNGRDGFLWPPLRCLTVGGRSMAHKVVVVGNCWWSAVASIFLFFSFQVHLECFWKRCRNACVRVCVVKQVWNIFKKGKGQRSVNGVLHTLMPRIQTENRHETNVCAHTRKRRKNCLISQVGDDCDDTNCQQEKAEKISL